MFYKIINGVKESMNDKEILETILNAKNKFNIKVGSDSIDIYIGDEYIHSFSNCGQHFIIEVFNKFGIKSEYQY